MTDTLGSLTSDPLTFAELDEESEDSFDIGLDSLSAPSNPPSAAPQAAPDQPPSITSPPAKSPAPGSSGTSALEAVASRLELEGLNTDRSIKSEGSDQSPRQNMSRRSSIARSARRMSVVSRLRGSSVKSSSGRRRGASIRGSDDSGSPSPGRKRGSSIASRLTAPDEDDDDETFNLDDEDMDDDSIEAFDDFDDKLESTYGALDLGTEDFMTDSFIPQGSAAGAPNVPALPRRGSFAMAKLRNILAKESVTPRQETLAMSSSRGRTGAMTMDGAAMTSMLNMTPRAKIRRFGKILVLMVRCANQWLQAYLDPRVRSMDIILRYIKAHSHENMILRPCRVLHSFVSEDPTNAIMTANCGEVGSLITIIEQFSTKYNPFLHLPVIEYIFAILQRIATTSFGAKSLRNFSVETRLASILSVFPSHAQEILQLCVSQNDDDFPNDALEAAINQMNGVAAVIGPATAVGVALVENGKHVVDPSCTAHLVTIVTRGLSTLKHHIPGISSELIVTRCMQILGSLHSHDPCKQLIKPTPNLLTVLLDVVGTGKPALAGTASEVLSSMPPDGMMKEAISKQASILVGQLRKPSAPVALPIMQLLLLCLATTTNAPMDPMAAHIATGSELRSAVVQAIDRNSALVSELNQKIVAAGAMVIMRVATISASSGFDEIVVMCRSIAHANSTDAIKSCLSALSILVKHCGGWAVAAQEVSNEHADISIGTALTAAFSHMMDNAPMDRAAVTAATGIRDLLRGKSESEQGLSLMSMVELLRKTNEDVTRELLVEALYALANNHNSSVSVGVASGINRAIGVVVTQSRSAAVVLAVCEFVTALPDGPSDEVAISLAKTLTMFESDDRVVKLLDTLEDLATDYPRIKTALYSKGVNGLLLVHCSAAAQPISVIARVASLMSTLAKPEVDADSLKHNPIAHMVFDTALEEEGGRAELTAERLEKVTRFWQTVKESFDRDTEKDRKNIEKLAMMMDQLEDARKQLAKSEEAKEEVVKAKEAEAAQAATLKESLSKAEEANQQLTKEKDGLKESHDKVAKELEDALKTRQELESKFEGAGQEIAAAEQARDEAIRKAEDLQGQLQQAHGDVEQARSDGNKAEEEARALREKSEKAVEEPSENTTPAAAAPEGPTPGEDETIVKSAEVQALREKNSELKVAHRELRSNLEKSQAEETKLKGRVAELESAATEGDQGREKLAAEVKSLADARDALQKELDAALSGAQGASDASTAQLTKVREELKEFRAKAAESEQQLQQQLKDANAKISTLEAESKARDDASAGKRQGDDARFKVLEEELATERRLRSEIEAFHQQASQDLRQTKLQVVRAQRAEAEAKADLEQAAAKAAGSRDEVLAREQSRSALLEKENTKLQERVQQLQVLEVEKKEMQHNIGRLESEVISLTAKRNALDSKLLQRDEQITRQREVIQKLEGNRDVDEVVSREKAEGQDATIGGLQNEITTLKSQISTMQSELEAARDKNVRDSEARARAVAEADAMSGKYADIDARLAQRTAEFGEIQSNHEEQLAVVRRTYEERIAATEHRLATERAQHTAALGESRKQMTRLTQERDSLTNTNRMLQDKVDAMVSQNEQKGAQHKATVNALQEAVDSLNQRVGDLMIENREQASILQRQHREEMENARVENRGLLHDQREAADYKMSSMVREHEEEVTQLKTSRDSLAVQVDELQQIVNQRPTNEIVEKLNHSLENLQTKHQTSLRSQVALAKVNAELETANTYLKNRVEDLTEKNGATEDSLQELLALKAERADEQRILENRSESLQAELQRTTGRLLAAEEARRSAELEVKRLEAANEFRRLADVPAPLATEETHVTNGAVVAVEAEETTVAEAPRSGGVVDVTSLIRRDEDESGATNHHQRRRLRNRIHEQVAEAHRMRLAPSKDPKDAYILDLITAIHAIRKDAASKATAIADKQTDSHHEQHHRSLIIHDGDESAEKRAQRVLKHASPGSWARDRAAVVDAFKAALESQRRSYESEVATLKIKLEQLVRDAVANGPVDLTRETETAAASRPRLAFQDPSQDMSVGSITSVQRGRSANPTPKRTQHRSPPRAAWQPGAIPPPPPTQQPESVSPRATPRQSPSSETPVMMKAATPRGTSASAGLREKSRRSNRPHSATTRRQIAAVAEVMAEDSRAATAAPTELPVATPAALNSQPFVVPVLPKRVSGGLHYDASSDPHLKHFFKRSRSSRTSLQRRSSARTTHEDAAELHHL